MGAGRNLAESNGRQKPAAQSKFRCLIIKIGAGRGFWKAALRITPYFRRLNLGTRPRTIEVRWHFPPPSLVMLGLRPDRPPRQHRNFVTSFIDPLIAFVSAHAWLAYLTLFLAALLEAVPVVGSVIPGSTIILALSALVPGGDLQAGMGAGWPPLPARCSATDPRSGSAIAASAKSSSAGRWRTIPA